MKAKNNAKKVPEAPEHLSDATKTWWRQVCSAYGHVLAPHDFILLRNACECLDRAEKARAQLAFEGITVATEFGQKAHPCTQIERENRALFARFVEQLKLDNLYDRVEPREG
jgi:phage terminase small subunit